MLHGQLVKDSMDKTLRVSGDCTKHKAHKALALMPWLDDKDIKSMARLGIAQTAHHRTSGRPMVPLFLETLMK